VELARALRGIDRGRGAPQVRFALFDGEEPAEGTPEEAADFFTAGLRGSRAYSASHRGEIRWAVILDYVGNRGLRLPREGSSTPALWARLRRAAASVGHEKTFPPGVQTTILDDHTPFLRSGVPAVDLIDWRYPGHDVSDRIDKLAPASLAATGESVAALVLGAGPSGGDALG
jgi:hypothetical protein